MKNKKAPIPKNSTIIQVYAASAGRCSYYGCNDYILNEPLTRQRAILGNIAHIVGESSDGPRGNSSLPLIERSKFDNLMLMCTKHHNFIDKKENWSKYPISILKKWKIEHEKRMKTLCAIPAASKSCALKISSQIHGHVTSVSEDEIMLTVLKCEKRYTDEKVYHINLGDLLDDNSTGYWKVAKNRINQVFKEEILPAVKRGQVERLSIFGLARIPILFYLGYLLGDKVPASFYQKHRDSSEGWVWLKKSQIFKFEIVGPNCSKRVSEVALFIQLSGGDNVNVQDIIPKIPVFIIRPIKESPKRTLFGSQETIENFRMVYHDFLSYIEQELPKVKKVNFFLATPAPIAILCGRDIQRSLACRLVVHDMINGKYKKIFTLN